jgi:hypothetical protein
VDAAEAGEGGGGRRGRQVRSKEGRSSEGRAAFAARFSCFANVWQKWPDFAKHWQNVSRARRMDLPNIGKFHAFLPNIGKLRSGWGAALPEAAGCA